MKSRSGIYLKEVFTEKDRRKESEKEVAGQYPFTRGVQKDMYKGRLWTMRQYAGFGTAEESNRRYHYLLSHGTTGLSVAFDLPTQLGFDPDHPRAKGEVGRVGVSISTIDDMRALFKDIDQSKVSTSMTINATGSILLAFYVAVAEERGVEIKNLRGTIQNDVLKEYIARGNYIYPPDGTLRLTTDIIDWCAKNIPKWNPISISGYHIREAGATAVQELAFTFSNAMTYVEEAVRRGLDVDQFAGQLSFFFNVHNDFLEEIAKFRAARKVWAKIMKERFKANDPRSCALRFHAQTAGSTLTAQQPYNNVVRVALQAMAAVLGGTQSLHTNSFDEALALPTEDAARLALRTQQIIADESNVIQSVDPVGGSFFIEALTDEIEKRTFEYIQEIERRGGTIQCIESGFIQTEIANSAYFDQKLVDEGKLRIVGVNCFHDQNKLEKTEILKVSPRVEKDAIKRIQVFKSKRSEKRVKESLTALESGVNANENLQGLIIHAVKSDATLGEIADVLRKKFGLHKEYGGF